MAVIKKKESWCLFIVKLTVMLSVMLSAWFWFTSNYKIGDDTQLQKCLNGGYKWFLSFKKETTPIKGNLMVFETKGLSPIFEDGTRMVKILSAVPGDRVAVNESGVLVNGELAAPGGAELAYKFGRKPEEFYGEKVLNENEYWFLGETKESFDSRYWGAVSREQIIARAIALL